MLLIVVLLHAAVSLIIMLVIMLRIQRYYRSSERQTQMTQQAQVTQPAADQQALVDQQVLIGQHISSYIETVDKFNRMVDDLYTSLPRSVLQAIQGSINTRKGKVGELITLLELSSEYDRLIPIGQPVDFIGISESSVDFIEVKVDSGRLSKEEKRIRDLVLSGKVNFITVKRTVDIEGIGEQMAAIDGV